MFTEEEWQIIEKAGFEKAVDLLNSCSGIEDDKKRNSEMHTLRCMSIYLIGELLGVQLAQQRHTHPGEVMAQFFGRISNDIIPIAIDCAKEFGVIIEAPTSIETVSVSEENEKKPIHFPEDDKLH